MAMELEWDHRGRSLFSNCDRFRVSLVDDGGQYKCYERRGEGASVTKWDTVADAKRYAELQAAEEDRIASLLPSLSEIGGIGWRSLEVGETLALGDISIGHDNEVRFTQLAGRQLRDEHLQHWRRV